MWRAGSSSSSGTVWAAAAAAGSSRALFLARKGGRPAAAASPGVHRAAPPALPPTRGESGLSFTSPPAPCHCLLCTAGLSEEEEWKRGSRGGKEEEGGGAIFTESDAAAHTHSHTHRSHRLTHRSSHVSLLPQPTLPIPLLPRRRCCCGVAGVEMSRTLWRGEGEPGCLVS